MRTRQMAVIAVIGTVLLSACELTPEEQAAILRGINDGLTSAQYDSYGGANYGGSNYGGVSGQSIRLCASRGNARPNLVYGTVRNGQQLNRAVGGQVYRNDRMYVTISTSYGTSLVSYPSWANPNIEPVYGVDRQGVRWRLTHPSGCSGGNFY